MQNMERSFDIDWGIFGLVEFIVSDGEKIGNIYKTALDIGSGQGKQTEVLRAAGLEVFQLDKYSDTAEYKVDLIEHDFGKQFDVIFCSHVIEHQRNVRTPHMALFRFPVPFSFQAPQAPCNVLYILLWFRVYGLGFMYVSCII